MNVKDLKRGQIWVWKKPEGMYAGMEVKFIIDSIENGKVYYDPTPEFEQHKKELQERLNEYDDFEMFNDNLSWSPRKRDNVLRDSYYLSIDSLLANGFQINRWDDWPLPEPTAVSSRLDDVE